MADLKAISSAVISGDGVKVKELVQQAIDDEIDPVTIIENGLIPGMDIVGFRYKKQEMIIPEVLIAARAMNAGIKLLRPSIIGKGMPSKGTVVIGTVEGDLHDIGKNLVAMMIESRGFKVVNLGHDVSPQKFVEAVKEKNAQILGMSALLTTTMLSMRDTIEVLKEEGLRDKVKVLVGGAPVTQVFADEIGADGFAPDAVSAAKLCRKLIG